MNAACGIRNVNGVGFRITGDKDGEAQFGEFPWTVAILKEDKAFDGQILNIFVCGGSIIDPGKYWYTICKLFHFKMKIIPVSMAIYY